MKVRDYFVFLLFFCFSDKIYIMSEVLLRFLSISLRINMKNPISAFMSLITFVLVPFSMFLVALWNISFVKSRLYWTLCNDYICLTSNQCKLICFGSNPTLSIKILFFWCILGIVSIILAQRFLPKIKKWMFAKFILYTLIFSYMYTLYEASFNQSSSANYIWMLLLSFISIFTFIFGLILNDILNETPQ
jgi:hypothetical protein